MKEEFIRRTSLAWGVSPEQAEQLLSTQYKTTIRINPLKVRKSTLGTLRKQYKTLKKIDWVDDTYTIGPEKVRPSTLPEFTNGEIIIQNPSSFIPVLELQPNAEDAILDMCAAPGGKSSHIAALTNNKAQIILNDTSRTRFFKMKKLMQTMDVQAEYSLRDGRFLSKEQGINVFDKILLDAPCSGEANMKLDKLDSWSLATIKRLHGLQTRLLQDAFVMLKPGGRLVYSTCTIATEENELVVDSLLKHNPTADIVEHQEYPVRSIPGITQWHEKQLDPRLYKALRLLPSDVCKPFFIAVITKTTAEEDDSYARLQQRYS